MLCEVFLCVGVFGFCVCGSEGVFVFSGGFFCWLLFKKTQNLAILWGFSLVILGENTPFIWMGELTYFTVFPVGLEHMKKIYPAGRLAILS